MDSVVMIDLEARKRSLVSPLFILGLLFIIILALFYSNFLITGYINLTFF